MTALESTDATPLYCWRHPRPQGAEGRCIGRTDLPVDPRRAKRLAHRIERHARRLGLPRIVVTSPLRRCADVGRCLRRRGWRHVIDPALLELDFGRWEGRRWDAIAHAEVDRWCADFVDHRPGGGEPLAALLARAAAWPPAGAETGARIAVVHAGWVLARRWAQLQPTVAPTADTWPPAPRHGALTVLP